MVTPSFAPHVGGVERHVAAVHRSLGEMGLRGRIVVLRDPPPEAASGAEWIGFPYGLSRLRVLARPGSLLRLLLGLQREAGAALHFHDAATLHPFLPYLRGLGLLDRTYVTFHGWEGVYPPEAVVRRQRAACAAAAAGTMIVGDFITKWYGTAGNCVTYGGADVARFASGFPPAAELPLRAAYVGRLEPDTGLPVILDAVRALRNEAGVAVPLTVFGTGSLEQEVRRELGAAAVERAPADILDVYRSHPIIFASGYLTILEALCAGRIVFACYDNPLRHDYLAMHPAADALTVCGGTPSVLEGLRACRDNMPAVLERSRPGWAWAREHSWARLAGQYRELWSGAERGLSLHG
jgi:glycosyltransferase involved in cell wall biosynthesis